MIPNIYFQHGIVEKSERRDPVDGAYTDRYEVIDTPYNPNSSLYCY
jgi:hypothetical protein